jgi:hypothetical protein
MKLENFFDHVDQTGECWPWLGATTDKGCGATAFLKFQTLPD